MVDYFKEMGDAFEKTLKAKEEAKAGAGNPAAANGHNNRQ